MDVIKNLDRHELVHMTAKKLGKDHDDVDEVVASFLQTFIDTMPLKGYAEIHGFGSFKLRTLAPRAGELPDGKEFSVGERITIDFNPFKPLQDNVEAVTGIECTY